MLRIVTLALLLSGCTVIQINGEGSLPNGETVKVSGYYSSFFKDVSKPTFKAGDITITADNSDSKEVEASSILTSIITALEKALVK